MHCPGRRRWRWSLLCLLACPPVLGQVPFMDWDLKMPVSWDLADLEHDAVPAIAAATATAAPPAAASSALCGVGARGAESGGVLRRPQARWAERLRRCRGPDEGAGGAGVGRGGCCSGAVREPDEAPAHGRQRHRRGVVPVVRGGRLQGRPQQVPRLPLPTQGLSS